MTSYCTIVLPTRHEQDNVGPLIAAIASELKEHPNLNVQLLFVDDSDDMLTVEAIQKARIHTSNQMPHIDAIHRPRGERPGQLAGAILAGIRRAEYDSVICADADLQHPPAELLWAAEALVDQFELDMVLPTRYRLGGKAPGLPPLRYLVSRASALAAHVLFPIKMRGVSDPGSGFFALKRGRLQLDDLNPIGFKVLIEILVRCAPVHFNEFGYEFGSRENGESNATLKQGVLYLRHLARLRLDLYKQAWNSRRTSLRTA